MRNGALREPMRDLREDLHAMARDAEALLRATANVTGEHVQDARARTEETLRRTFDHLYDRKLRKQMRRFAHSTDTYVRDNSWTIIGAVAGIALVAGMLSFMRRR